MRLGSFPRENLYGLGDANHIVGSSRRRLVSAGRRRRLDLSPNARSLAVNLPLLRPTFTADRRTGGPVQLKRSVYLGNPAEVGSAGDAHPPRQSIQFRTQATATAADQVAHHLAR
jgi:hypothetical protein